MQNNSFINQLNDIIETHLHDENFGVSELAKQMAINRTVLYRKIKKYTNKTASQYINQIRLQKSLELLKDPSKTVSEVAYEVGFGSPSYFIKCFHDYYGYPPGERQKPENIDSKKPTTEKAIKKKNWLIPASILLTAMVLTSAVYFLFYSSKEEAIITIAVLPPNDISPKGEKCILLEGFREYLQIKLNSIEEFQVSSSTSTEVFRTSNKNLKEIALELDVDYIVEVSGQEINGKAIIFVQLIDAKTDKHIWAQPFEEKVDHLNFFNTQERIATLVANSFHIKISGTEKQKIEKAPTKNIPALERYNYGLNELQNYYYSGNKDDYLHAKVLFEEAIELDSSFADAYFKLGTIYISIKSQTITTNNPYRELYINYLDSGLYCINTALELGVGDMEAALMEKSRFHQYKGEHDEAINILEMIWRNKKKTYKYYAQKGNYHYLEGDMYNSLDNYFHYYNLIPEDILYNRAILHKMAILMSKMEFTNAAIQFAKKSFEQHGDSTRHWYFVQSLLGYSGDYEELESKYLKALEKDPTNLRLISLLGFSQVVLKKYEECYQLFGIIDSLEMHNYGKRIPDVFYGYCLNVVEQDTAIANWHYKNAAKEVLYEIENQITPFVQSYEAHGYLAACYSCLNEKEKAIEYLSYLKNVKDMSKALLIQFEQLDVYDNIRNVPEFNALVKEFEQSYRKNQEKVKSILIKQGLEPI